MTRKKVVAIVGPTGSGKSGIAVKLAHLFDGEIISADSMQIYKDMNIGTAKVDDVEMDGIKHYLIDEVLPTENFSVWDWKCRAEDCIEQIACSGKLPIIAGGTGLYVNALLNNFNFYGSKNFIPCREKYEQILKEKGVDFLYSLLEEKDAEFAHTVDKNKTRAIIRYLEILENDSSVDLKQKDEENKYDYLLIGLDLPREELYQKINARVDKMFDAGLLAEVEALVEKYNLGRNLQSGQAIGYKEFWDYYDDKCDLTRVSDLIKQHTRNYAKRQVTYMKKMPNIQWVSPKNFDTIKNMVKEFLNNDK